MASVAVSRKSSVCAPYDSSKPHHPPTLTMVLEAVKALSQPKGVSAVAIKRYILQQYPDVDPVRLKYYLKQALVKGVNRGYLVRPPKSSAQGASGSFKLGKEKTGQGKGHEKKFSDEEAELEVAVTKQPKAKAPKQKSKSKGAVQAKKTSSKKPSEVLDDGGAAAPGAEPVAKASKKEAAKATKHQGAPKASQVKPTSSPKKAALKTKAELKGLPEAKVKQKPSRDEKAKRGAEPKGAIARSRAASETKAARAKGKPRAKKGAASGQEKEKATAGPEA